MPPPLEKPNSAEAIFQSQKRTGSNDHCSKSQSTQRRAGAGAFSDTSSFNFRTFCSLLFIAEPEMRACPPANKGRDL